MKVVHSASAMMALAFGLAAASPAGADLGPGPGFAEHGGGGWADRTVMVFSDDSLRHIGRVLRSRIATVEERRAACILAHRAITIYSQEDPWAGWAGSPGIMPIFGLPSTWWHEPEIGIRQHQHFDGHVVRQACD